MLRAARECLDTSWGRGGGGGEELWGGGGVRSRGRRAEGKKCAWRVASTSDFNLPHRS